MDTAQENASEEVCRAFRNNGRCRYGDNCRYVHSEGPPIQPTETVRKECFDWRDNGSCSHGDRCKFSHGENDSRLASNPADEICRNFQRGRCKFGEECRRKHVEAPAGEAGERERKPRERKPRKKREAGEEKGESVDPADEVCRNFLNGRCRYGEECRRKHEGTPKESTAADGGRRRRREARPVKKLDEVCNNYQAGKCRLGDRCRRQHVDKDGNPAPAEEVAAE